ncbi:MAG: hypothetical protein ACT4PP_16040 [Sporichthyaceae bacterium]
MSGKHRRQPVTARRRLATGAMVSVITPAVATFGMPAAAAAEDPSALGGTTSTLTSFTGKASADGIRARISLKDYLIVEDFIDGGGPTAQAALNSLGDSTAFSSLPYPGETGVAFPGLVSTLSGKSVPGYPFIAQSQNPSVPQVTISQPGYIMHAESSDTRSAAETQMGTTTNSGEELGSFSTVFVEVIDGVLTSRGEARSRFAIGAFSLEGAVSKAEVVRKTSGKIVKSASFEGGLINLGGTKIGVTNDGLVIGEQSAAGPTDSFASEGVTVNFLPAVETADSILSSGLEISFTRPVPNVGSATAVVSYIVGRSFAQADGGSVTSLGTDATETPAGASPALSEVAELPAASAGPVLTPQTAVVTAPAGAPAPAAPQSPAAPATVDLITAAGGERELTEIEFYPLLAVLVPVLALAALGARAFI